MLKRFAEKERLKDQLLNLIKRDKNNTFKVDSIDPTAKILIRMFDNYEEILEEQGDPTVAGNYLFEAIASYVLMSVQLTETNKLLVRLLTEYEKGE